MPYVSDQQRKFFHTATAKKKGITAKTVKDFDAASKGMKLPAKKKKKSEHHPNSHPKAPKKTGG